MWPLLGLGGSDFNDIMETKALLTASDENCSVVRRLDYQPLHEKWARASPPNLCGLEVSHLFSCIFRGRGAPSGRSGFTTPPEPRRKTTRDRPADAGDDATPEADAEP